MGELQSQYDPVKAWSKKLQKEFHGSNRNLSSKIFLSHWYVLSDKTSLVTDLLEKRHSSWPVYHHIQGPLAVEQNLKELENEQDHHFLNIRWDMSMHPPQKNTK